MFYFLMLNYFQAFYFDFHNMQNARIIKLNFQLRWFWAVNLCEMQIDQTNYYANWYYYGCLDQSNSKDIMRRRLFSNRGFSCSKIRLAGITFDRDKIIVHLNYNRADAALRIGNIYRLRSHPQDIYII